MCVGKNWDASMSLLDYVMWHPHHWQCTDTPGIFKCINTEKGKCKAIRTYDRETETYTVTYSYKRLGATA